MIIWFCVILPSFYVFFSLTRVYLFCFLFCCFQPKRRTICCCCMLCFCGFACFCVCSGSKFIKYLTPCVPKQKQIFRLRVCLCDCVVIGVFSSECVFVQLKSLLPLYPHHFTVFACLCVLFCLYCECVCQHSPTVQCKQFSVFILLLEPLFEAAAIDCHVQCMLASTSISFIQTSIS